MRGSSHVVFGLAGAILIANIPPDIAGPSLFGGETLTIDHVAQKVIFYGLAALGALAPDIDNANSTIGKRLRPLSRAAQHMVGHRTFFHSLLAMAIIGGIILGCQYAIGVALYHFGLYATGASLGTGFLGIAFAGFMVGYFLHLVADSLTLEGVPWLWPYHAYFGFPPERNWRFRTGSIGEPIIVIVVAVATLVAVIFGKLGV